MTVSEHSHVWQANLRAVGACREAVEWAKPFDTFEAAWDACERGDWMLWLAGKTVAAKQNSPARKRLVLVACECAHLSLPFVREGEDRPRIAIETAERYAKGEDVSLTDVRAAADAAAYTAYAAYAAAYAAYAAAYAAAAADDAAAAADAARKSTLKQCADIVRSHFTAAEFKM